MIRKSVLIAGLLGLLAGGGAVALATGSLGADPDEARIEEVVRAYILENPEILPEAMQRLQDRELAEAVDENRAAFETPFAGAWAGAEDGDVVLVEFFDYACGYCRKSNEDIDRLLSDDPKLKVVWRELPVLGPDSNAAAQASLAAAAQGRFRPFYNALFAQGRPTAQAIAAAQAAAGVAPSQPTAEMQKEIQNNYQLAGSVRASGTPVFVVGDKVLHGAVGYDALKAAIAEARAS